MLPDLLPQEQLPGSIAVVIDILRATSTMTTALFHGASEVVPCRSIEEAHQLRVSDPSGKVVLGGERGGVRIPGFDLGNSPASYDSQTIGGRRLGFTTTNGTRALLNCLNARKILTGSFLNLSAILHVLQNERRPVHLVCAGTDGFVTGEDVLFAGAVVWRLKQLPATGGNSVDVSGIRTNTSETEQTWVADDSAQVACSYWIQQISSRLPSTDDLNSASPDVIGLAIEQVLRQTRGGRNLIELGYVNDLEICSRIDAAPVVPVLWQSTIAADSNGPVGALRI